jgi:hypothetical protein
MGGGIYSYYTEQNYENDAYSTPLEWSLRNRYLNRSLVNIVIILSNSFRLLISSNTYT